MSKPRSLDLIRKPTALLDGWFVVREGKDEQHYSFMPLQAQDGVSKYRVCRHGDDEAQHTYVVTLLASGRAECGCKGFRYRRSCRHTAALAALRRLGHLKQQGLQKAV